jgi:hypothetical protein
MNMRTRKAVGWDERYPQDTPPKEFWTNQFKITQAQIDQFRNLVHSNCGETEIDQFLRENKEILAQTAAMYSLGGHGLWVIEQQSIRTSVSGGANGMIPDYIVGGANSDGYQWFIVELKGPCHSIFSGASKKIGFSSVVNQGFCQLIEYIDYSASYQSYLREYLHLNDFREPTGLLIVGREQELFESSRKKELKSAMNRFFGNKIQIRTYDALLRIVERYSDFASSNVDNSETSTDFNIDSESQSI